jgi:hypothetical protein
VVAIGLPDRFGRCTPENVPVLSLCVMPIGNPLWKFIAADTVQPPRNQSAGPDVAHLRPRPNGSSAIGATISRCGTSSSP